MFLLKALQVEQRQYLNIYFKFEGYMYIMFECGFFFSNSIYEMLVNCLNFEHIDCFKINGLKIHYLN